MNPKLMRQDKAIEIRLSLEEGLAAAMQGATQMMRAIRSGKVGFDHGGTSVRSMKERWAESIQGQMAEHAYCKAMGHYPFASADGINGDDPGGVAIRSTPWPPSIAHLIVFRKELPACEDKPFVLVCGHWPDFVIAGWILGRDAARDEWCRKNETPSRWWVPAKDLLPMSELRGDR